MPRKGPRAMQGLLSSGGARLLLALLLLRLRRGSGSCPCQDPSLCTPITGRRDFEVRMRKEEREEAPGGVTVKLQMNPLWDMKFIDVTLRSPILCMSTQKRNWTFYDWSQITTVAAFGNYDPDLMCHAHSKGSRIVFKGNTSVKKIVKPALRAAWISRQVKRAKEHYMDGINIDIEEEITKFSPEYFALTALVKETADAFHKEIPGSQVTFDMPWSPECIDNKCFNFTGIADSCDFVFVMSYDEPSQLWSTCTVTGTAPYNQTLSGYDAYLHLGISPKKLVMGVPWYGYDYVCLYFSEGHICHFANVTFRGAQCRFSGGQQVPYRIIMNRAIHSVSGIHWDEEQGISHLEYKDPHGVFHQIWFDDPRSISMKAAYVKEHGLRGIGMWNGNCLDYYGSPLAVEQSRAMWEALKPQ